MKIKMTMPVAAILAVLFLAGYAYAGSFTDNGNGTVTDNSTGLRWQKCSAGQNALDCSGTATPLRWQGALDYCNNLSLAGYSGWRIPNIKELESLVEHTVYSPAINTTYFPNTQRIFYWSNSYDVFQDTYAWAVNFGGGYSGPTSKTNTWYVRCVR